MFDILSQAVVPLISAAAGLGGVALGGFLTLRNQRQERRLRFARDQLAEFYAPMLGLRKRVRAKSEIRSKVRDSAASEWEKRIGEAREAGAEYTRQTLEEQRPKYKALLEYDNRQFGDELLPSFRQMLEVFTTKMHFAEPSTRKHFTALVEFLEMWERWLKGALPAEVAEQIGPNEDSLAPLFADLEQNFECLQTALKE